jgi:hypothetical protein
MNLAPGTAVDTAGVPLVVADTVTSLDGSQRGAVLVTGSHGGIIAAFLAAEGGARAAIFNDAGVGRDAAGIAGLAYLAAIGMAAAAVAHTSARIADGADALAHGTISHRNAVAAACGVEVGMRCADAARCLAAAPLPTGSPPPYANARFLLRARSASLPEVWGLDSIGMVEPRDAGRVLVIGSHGALHGGRADTALPVAARAAIFHDAGVGKDGAGCSRLPVLAARGIAAATVDFRSARIGDARSIWETGILSCVNAPGKARGWHVGEAVQAATAR